MSFFAGLADTAYKVTLDDNGDLVWDTTINGKHVRERTEPASGTWRRFKAWFLKVLPDSQL